MESSLKDIAESINAELKMYSAKKLYVTANFFSASDNYPDRIVVEGIKNLRSTGKFTNDDILQVRTAIKNHFSSKTLSIEENLSDRAMYIAVITKKAAANESKDIEEADVEFDIPASEWDKVASYISKGSDFKKVAVMCVKNKVKYTSRYLILKKLGLEQAANAFIDGLRSKLSYNTVEDLKNTDVSSIEVPEKYKSLSDDKDTLQATFAANREKFKKAHQAGPLKELAKIGIEYLLCYSDGSGKDGKKIANQLAADNKIPTYKPSYDWVGNNGLRQDLPMVVYMTNGKLKSGSKYFGYVIHTLETVDSGNQGYSLFEFTDGQHTHADGQSMNVSSAIKWIRDNVEKE